MFAVPAARKQQYGEVTTPYEIIDEILDGIPTEMYGSGKEWLDVGAGYGYFGDRVMERAGASGARVTFSEINPEHVQRLQQNYGPASVADGDFLQHTGEYNAVIGNPPYVVEGAKKVPTMAGVDKKNDGRTSWTLFVKHALSLLKPGGYLGMVVPCLWLRQDKAGIHALMFRYRLVRARCYGASECSRLFKGKAQTPVVAFVLRKVAPLPDALLYCGAERAYVTYPASVDTIVPTGCASLVKKFVAAKAKLGGIRFSKTNMPPAKVKVGIPEGGHLNVKTVVLNGLTPTLVVERSGSALAWNGVPKVILGHKMYGLPYIDRSGKYGISSRDNYVIAEADHPNMTKLRAYLETRIVRCLFSCFRYRMRYLEREALEHLFDPSSVESLPDDMTNGALASFLRLSEAEIEYVNAHSGREYARTREN